MKFVKNSVIIILILMCGIILLSVMALGNYQKIDEDQYFLVNSEQKTSLMDSKRENDIVLQSTLRTSSTSNAEIIESVLQSKLDEYGSLGYFLQLYEPSLQATYQALYILDSIGKLNEIDQDSIVNYIMSKYDADLKLFMDEYAYRYLDTDYDQIYYPLSSVLEVNCYAVLSLKILERLDLINDQEFINYVWSCYQPSTSGFVGQSYDSELPTRARLATIDNTYYAVITLNALGINWFDYPDEVTALKQYIESLQSESLAFGRYGGFSNDNDASFETLRIGEPNLISSYYSIKCLIMLSGLSGNVITDFWKYLENTYVSTSKSFKLSSTENNHLNIIATAIGLELSDLTGYFSIDREGVITYLLNNRNSLGTWNGSTSGIYYELIDTFQVVRSLHDAGEMGRLTSEEKDDIVSTLQSYLSYDGGYSPLPEEYTSQALLNTIVNAFVYNERLYDLDLDFIYSQIMNSYLYNSYYKIHSFHSYTPVDSQKTSHRSYPVEYNSIGTHQYIMDINDLITQESVFHALDSLDKMGKLNVFSIGKDLSEISDNVISSQFLQAGYGNTGGFLSFCTASYSPSPSYQDSRVYMIHSYYAIKTLKLLDAYLSTNKFDDIDTNALENYVNSKIIEDPATLFIDPDYSDDVDLILENTYYGLYILRTLDRYTLDDHKIETYILQNINYSDIRNVYYCYKIDQLLGLELEFNLDASQDLIQQLYSNELFEFYETPHQENLNQVVMKWICEMAANDRVRINHDVPSSVQLEEEFTISASLCNLILEDFGPYVIVKFESNQLGAITLEKRANNLYQKMITIPDELENYPLVEGNITAYDNDIILASVPISIQTTRAPEEGTSQESDDGENSGTDSDSGNSGADSKGTSNDEELQTSDADTVENELVNSLALSLSVFSIVTPSFLIGTSTFYKRRIRLKLG